MTLLSKGSYDFTNIVDYDIDKQDDVIAQKKLANGNRKKIYNDYEDIIINVTFGKFSLETFDTVYDNLVDGEYTYTLRDGVTTATASFLVTKPEVKFDNGSTSQEFKVLLEKASD